MTTEPPTTTGATTTTTTGAPTTTVDPLVQSQTAYFVITSDTNGRGAELFESLRDGDGIPWESMPAFCTERAVIDEDFVRMVQETSWIPEVQDEIDELVAANVASLTYTYQCSNAPGTYDAQEPIDAAGAASIQRVGEAASAVRFALDLPIERE